MTIDLKAEFGQTPGQNPTVFTKYGNTGKTGALKNLYAWLNSLGMSDATIGTIDSFSAEHNEMVWRTHGYYTVNNNKVTGTGWHPGAVCNSKVNIEWPDGIWKIRMSLLGAHGAYWGQRALMYLSSDGFTFGTEITPDHDNWIGIPGLGRHGMVSATYGAPAEAPLYAESFWVDQVYLNGGMSIGPRDTSFESSGIFVTNSGSRSGCGAKIDNWNDGGVHLVGAIPFKLDHVRAFRNNRASLLLEGTALSSVEGMLECDDSAAGIEMITGRNGQAAGLGAGAFTLLKFENGKKTTRPMNCMVLRGQVNMSVLSMRASFYNNVRPEALVQWDTDSVNSWLAVMGFSNSGTSANGGPHYLAKTRTKTYPAPLNSDGFGFSIKSGNLLSGQR